MSHFQSPKKVLHAPSGSCYTVPMQGCLPRTPNFNFNNAFYNQKNYQKACIVTTFACNLSNVQYIRKPGLAQPVVVRVRR